MLLMLVVSWQASAVRVGLFHFSRLQRECRHRMELLGTCNSAVHSSKRDSYVWGTLAGLRGLRVLTVTPMLLTCTGLAHTASAVR